MKRSCKDVDLRDPATVQPWVEECVTRHRKRHDFRRLLARSGGLRGAELDAAQAGDRALLARASRAIAGDMCARIAARELALPPVTYRERVDASSGKTRLIGNEDAAQQVLDYIAVRASAPIWRRRIVAQQVAGMPGRGALYAMRMIRGWVEADDRAARWAKAHHVRYTRRCRFHVKLDVRKCYPSLRVGRFMALFERDCANRDLLWLWEALLSSHAGDGYEGFMIGAMTSQWACQYMLSFLWRHAMALTHATRRGHRVRSVEHMALQMDDLLLVGCDRRALVDAARSVASLAQALLGLEVKGGWQALRLVESPIDLAGWRVHHGGCVDMRPRIALRTRRSVLRFRCRAPDVRRARRVTAYYGWARNASSGRFRRVYAVDRAAKSAAKMISEGERA